MEQNLWEQKQERKLERYQRLATKNKQQSESVYNAGKIISDMIPMGQPVILNHHSTKRHLRDIERIHNSMRKSIELADKAEYYENKVENILNPRAISSDDPEAIVKLKAEIEKLETARDEMKRVNTYYKKNKTLEGVNASELCIKAAESNMRVWGGVYSSPFPSYELTNTGASIRTKQKRIAYLESLNKMEEVKLEGNGIRLETNKEENRVQLFFPGKPSEEIRTKLKSNGFRWSPYNGCWQRQISNWAIEIAKEFINERRVEENGTEKVEDC